ncbi:MAG TPA: hypothetical protein VM891_05905 [Amaricoccus sp.]|nr:hypothetical protein [Amaricoccus sp.]
MKYTVIFRLQGVLAAAAAVEWTVAGAPGAADWRPCQRLADGRWRLAGHDSAGSAAAHWREPGLLGNIGLRYRLTAGGPWSPVSADRKEIAIVAVRPDDPLPAARAGDWSVPVPYTLPGGGRSGAFVLGGVPAAAVAAQWTAATAPGAADWHEAVALADGRWHLGQAVAGNLEGLAIRWRLTADGAWSPISEDRKPLGFPDLPVLPVALVAPALAGSGRIGAAVAALGGVWTGAPALAFQWCRDGAPIAGATAASYRPVAADDRGTLSCRLTATTAAGSATAVTAGLAVTWPAPAVVAGVLDEEILDQGAGSFVLAAAPAFSGGGLSFAVAGAGATIDAATGMLSIPTDTARSDRVTVTATNSGGAASVGFAVTVEAGETPTAPPALAAANWSIPATAEIAAGRHAGVVEVAATGPAAAAAALEWTDAAAPGAAAGLTLTALGNRRWRMDDPSGAGRNAVAAGGAKAGIALRYRLAADGPWADWSADRKGFTAPSAAYWRPIERNPEMLARAPERYGFGYQFMRCMMACESAPQYVIGGGDMNGIRLSETGGASWFHPASKGLRCPGFNSVAIDPVDRNLLLAMGNMVWWGASNAKNQARCGVWRSTDFGATWSFAQAMDNAGSDDYNQSLFAYAPASRSAAAAARVWFLMQSVRPQGEERLGAQFWRSADGGASWAKVGAQAAATTFNEMYVLVAHPTAANRLYLAAQSGLWATADGGATWSKVAGGLPGAQCRSLAISADGKTLYASIQSTTAASNGVWRSANGGTSWTRIYDANPVKRLAVDWGTSPETIHVQLNQSTGADLVVARGPSGSWTRPTVTPMLGYESDDYHGRLSTKGSYDGLIVPKAGTCLVNAVGRLFRSEDGGASFRDSSLGYTGLNFAAQLNKVAVHPSNPDRIAIAVQDINLFVSTDRGRSGAVRQVPGTVFNELAAANGTLKASPRSSYGIAILPSGRILLSLGTATVQALVSTDDDGESYAAVLSAPAGDYNFIGFHPKTPTAVAAGGRRSTDGGATFPTALAYVAQGISTGGALYGRSGNNAVLRSANWASGTPTWTEFYTSAASIRKYGLNSHLMAVDPHDEYTIWTVDAGGDLIRVRNTGSAAAAAQVTGFPIKGEAWGGPAADFEIADIARDPTDAALVYVTLFGTGIEAIWRGRIAGATVAWENLTLNAPRWQDLSISVLPGSGDVIVGGGVGGWVLPGAAGTTALAAPSVWSGLAEPVRR